MSTRTHGQSGNTRAGGVGRTPTYQCWANMVQRCTNPNRGDFHRYGGRGITPCKRWLVFENFLEDMGERPEGTTLDRRRNSHGYTKQNCRWITQQEQCRNQDKTVMVTIDGVTKPRIVWCEDYGIPEYVVRARVNRNKWDVLRALTTPVMQRGRSDNGRIAWS